MRVTIQIAAFAEIFLHDRCCKLSGSVKRFHISASAVVNIAVSISDMWMIIVLTHVTSRSIRQRSNWPKGRFSDATAQRLHHVPLGRQRAVVSIVC